MNKYRKLSLICLLITFFTTAYFAVFGDVASQIVSGCGIISAMFSIVTIEAERREEIRRR
jgi:hypothetical protein